MGRKKPSGLRRTSKTVGAIATGFLYDGLNPLTGPIATANLLTGPGIDEYFSRSDALRTKTFLTDAFSTLALTDNTGAIKSEYAYEPYGKTTSTGETNTNSFQYTGREDDNTG